MIRRLLSIFALIALGLLLSGALALWLGGPGTPTPLGSISTPFESVDYSTLPPPRRDIKARDGTPLIYRRYAAESGGSRGSVVLVHGSSARGSSMHALSQAYAAAGFEVYALDMRGHGDTGTRGRISYVGQLEHDLEDFVSQARPARPAVLAGFSAGGGFALRFAGGPSQKLFDAYVLLAPFVSQEAASYRPDSGGWVQVGVSRIVALVALNRLGVDTWNDLTVTRFALPDAAKAHLTPAYSFALALNFRPQLDYRANIAAVSQPVAVIAGAEDEAFFATRYAEDLKPLQPEWTIELIPGVGHASLVVTPTAAGTIIEATQRLAPQKAMGS
jgi:non-heme chloroperoxidase